VFTTDEVGGVASFELHFLMTMKVKVEVVMTSSANIYDAIVAADQTFMNIFSKGDAAGIANLYTKDGQFLPPNSDFVTGRPAIQATFQGFMDMGIKEIKLKTLEVDAFGDTASEIGTYILETKDGQVLDQGKFSVIWKLEEGQWKLHRDMINTSMPATH